MKKCIKWRTWFIIIVMVVVAIVMFFIMAVLANENEPEPRTFGGTFVMRYLNECLYQAPEKSQFM